MWKEKWENRERNDTRKRTLQNINTVGKVNIHKCDRDPRSERMICEWNSERRSLRSVPSPKKSDKNIKYITIHTANSWLLISREVVKKRT